ncbi:hypothetical protein [Nocardia rhizosphaerihabitans]|uniref:TetR family transcriptional regulator n=1 Tax=Nocardia rhizosphaerihabitans TaxID=1691570 RepID=A0ABQ2K6S1_9NOCA|nr:hypothetical protein [Nocardia rhizosphaerihabitans]GGN72876.1 hypothetical protein GCM10011610_14660 [Nocardia rhizosphaerihabitans]
MEQILDSLPADDPADPTARLEEFWQRLITSFGDDSALWQANAECLNQALHSPELRTELAAAQELARRGLSEAFGNDSTVGAVIQTMIGGLLMQWLIDPMHAPSAAGLTAGVEALLSRPVGRPIYSAAAAAASASAASVRRRTRRAAATILRSDGSSCQ